MCIYFANPHDDLFPSPTLCIGGLAEEKRPTEWGGPRFFFFFFFFLSRSMLNELLKTSTLKPFLQTEMENLCQQRSE